MHVRAQPDVVSQIPPVVIGIGVDDDVVGIPQPAVAEVDIVWRDAEVVAIEPEPSRTAALEMPDVAATDFTRETAMLPRMIEMIVRIVAARVVADPVIGFHIDVGSIRVPRFLAIVALLLLFWRRGVIRMTFASVTRMAFLRSSFRLPLGRRRTAGGNVAAADLGPAIATML